MFIKYNNWKYFIKLRTKYDVNKMYGDINSSSGSRWMSHINGKSLVERI